MSEITSDRNALIAKYCDEFPDMLDTLGDTVGIVRAYALRTANRTWTNLDVDYNSDNSPFKYIRYHDPAKYNQRLLGRAKSLIKQPVTRDTYGFSLKSLLELDYATFTSIEDAVFEATLADIKTGNKGSKELKNLLKL